MQAGEEIVVNGLERVRPGMPVTAEEEVVEAASRFDGKRAIAVRNQTNQFVQRTMNFSHFFIRRPIFAGVLSIAIFVMGLLAMFKLPISEYPEVVPPTIVVRATFPGATPKTIAETVASPLEQAINGVEGSLYMFSQATADGVMNADRDVQARHRP